MVDDREQDVEPRDEQRRRPARAFDDRGASMVEFALVLPLLILIIFGIVEFGYLYAQHLDVRHGAREGARMASVNYDPESWGGTNITAGQNQLAQLINDTCERMDFADNADVTVSLVDDTGTATEDNQPGDYIQVQVSATPEQITGLFGPVIDPITLDSTVQMRIETTFAPVLAMGGSPRSYNLTCAAAAAAA